MTSNAYVALKRLLPPPSLLVGKVTAHHTDDETSTVVLPTQQGVNEYAAGVATGSTIRARGTFVPVGANAFVRDGVIESRAPDENASEIVIGAVVPVPMPLTFNGPIPDQTATVGATVAVDLTGYWSGGLGAPTFTVASGTLPAGLTLSTAGVISGTPTTAAIASGVVLRATDTAGYRVDSNAVGFDVAAPAAPRMVGTVGTRAWYSDDAGQTWVDSGFDFPSAAVRIAWGGGVFVAIHEGALDVGAIYTSTDGIAWVSRTSGGTIARRMNVVWSGSLFVVACSGTVPGNNNIVETSPDGVTWTPRSLPVVAGVGYPAFLSASGGMLFCGINTGGLPRFAISGDGGVTWTGPSPHPFAGAPRANMVGLGGTYVLFGLGPVTVQRTTAFSSFVTGEFLSMGYNNPRAASNGATAVCILSSGLNSSSDLSGAFALRLPGTWTSVFWTGAEFVAIRSGWRAASADGITWVETAIPTVTVRAVAFYS